MSAASGNEVVGATGGAEERHEVKFAAYASEYSRVKEWLHMHAAGFVSPFPERLVNNVYFDNWDYRAFAENLAGVSRRSKVRYRWYGDSPGPAAGALEVKLKRNHFGWKQRYKVAEAPWQPGRPWSEVRAVMRRQLPLRGRLWLDQNPLPIMINRYRREYFVSGDGLVRATIDREQVYYDQRYGSQLNFDRMAIKEDTIVFEFKFSRKDRQLAVGILADIPLRVGRHSKYMNAVRSIAFT